MNDKQSVKAVVWYYKSDRRYCLVHLANIEKEQKNCPDFSTTSYLDDHKENEINFPTWARVSP